MSETAENDPEEDLRSASGLSPRQKDCLDLVAEGLTSKQIARSLKLSPKTVDHHIAAAIKALDANTRVEAALRLKELRKEVEESEPGWRTDQGLYYNGTATPLVREVAQPRWKAGSHGIVLPPLGGAFNTASRAERWHWIIRIAILSLMTTSVITLTILGLVELFGRLE